MKMLWGLLLLSLVLITPAHFALAGDACPKGAVLTTFKGQSLSLKPLCFADRCAMCRDLVRLHKCSKPTFNIIYMGSTTQMPMRRIKQIKFTEAENVSITNFNPAQITLRDGKTFKCQIEIKTAILPLVFCGYNDLGTISCISAADIKQVDFH